jgi:MFS family permease
LFSLTVLLVLLIIPISAWILFFYFESRPQSRLIGLDIFKNRIFSFSGSSMLLVFLALASVSVLMPFYLEQVRHLDPDHVGLFLTIIPACILIMAPLAGYLADRFQARYISTLGISIMLIGFIKLLSLKADSDYSHIVFILLFVGLGMGLFSTPNNSTIMGAVRQSQLGSASGIMSTIRSLGLALGVAMAIALFGIYRDQFLADKANEIAGFMFGYRSVYQIMLFVLIPAGILSFLRGDGAVRK